MNALFPRCWRRWAALVLCLATLTPVFAADELPVARGVLMDPQHSFSIEDVLGKEFRPVPGPIGRGFTDSAVWLRIEVPPSELPELRLVVQPAQLDDLRLYSPNWNQEGAQTGWTVQQLGDQLPFAERPLPEVYATFAFQPSLAQPTVLYLRVATTSVMQLHARVFSPAGSMRFDTGMHVFMGLYGGLLVAMMAFALVCWRITRDPLWGLDALMQLASLVFVLFIMGFMAQYLLPNSPLAADRGTSLMAATHLFVASVFFWRFLIAFRAPRWTHLNYLLPMAVFPLLVYWIFTGKTREAMALNANLVLLETLGGTLVVWFLKSDDRRLLWMARFLYVTLVFYMLYFVLPLLGLARMTELHLYPALLANFFTGVMVQVILARRTQLQIRDKWRLEADMRQLDIKLKGEVERHAATSSFLGMMMHELKTPLATIRLATQSLTGGQAGDDHARRERRLTNIQKAVDNIDGVLERCVEVDRLEQGALSTQKQQHDVAALVADWTSIEPQRSRLKLQVPQSLLAQVDAPLTCLMLRNLVHNALNYSPPDSAVDVTLTEKDEGFAIAVRNRAGRAGVPDPDLLFGKYYRADTAKHLTGTGLGLYWVRRVAEILGGTVRYRDEGNEVVFELWLPC
jgi:two-component system, sensor histidine kinase LadS